ncbi:MAG: TIGR04002 family protein [Synergistaceae bacterium]|nr:TIGR04002 family protein [Synergistaceae bacterium]
MRKNERIYNVVIAGLFTGLIFIMTAYFPRIPTARGYIHIGDAAIYLAASILPQPAAALSAALGGFLADAMTGYMIWAPYTFAIKACLTLAFTSKKGTIMGIRNVFAAAVAFPITIGGYYAAAWIMTGDMIVPLAEVPANAVQAAGSMALYMLFAACMDKTRVKTRIIGNGA